ncbi:MAG: hypothetical protein Q8P61_07395, partial [Candidatus Nanopelagicales bacterium]|nr:hypothetical protein [Candidatus Nanopelagicales bacterium]
INLAISFVLGSFIDWRAHLGGLVVGTAVAVLFAHGPNRRQAVYRVIGCAAIVVILAGAVSWRTTELSSLTGPRQTLKSAGGSVHGALGHYSGENEDGRTGIGVQSS